MTTPFTRGFDTPPPRICRVCRQVLNIRHDVTNDKVVYTHTTAADHDPEPVPMTSGVVWQCDFCAVLGADWSYPCDDFDTVVVVTPGHVETQTMRGAWRACNDCHDDIEHGRWGELIDRASPAARHHDQVQRELVRLYQGFRAHRGGPAEFGVGS